MNTIGNPVLVIDCGTTSLRFSVVSAAGSIIATRRAVVDVTRDADGAYWDGAAIAKCILSEVGKLVSEYSIAGIAIANQRTTCLIWDAQNSKPLGPVLSWSDSRTRELDHTLRSQGVRHTPGLTATKLRWLLDQVDADRALSRSGKLKGGTLDSWIVWILTNGQTHITDHVNASQTGLFDISRLEWDAALAQAMCVPLSILPVPVHNICHFGVATAIPGSPPILAVIGDQQASLFGQGCVMPGATKITFGTVGVVNSVLGPHPLKQNSRDAFGNIALSTESGVSYGAETSMQSAGSAVEWLIRAGVLNNAESIDALVDPHKRSEAIFVSALDGLAAPYWKPAARAAFLGLSASDGKAELVRAVLDGVVCATAEILDRLELAIGSPLGEISIDGGLSSSKVFREILVKTTDRTIRIAEHSEATTLGAAALGFVALGQMKLHDLIPNELSEHHVLPSIKTIAADRIAWSDGVRAVLNDYEFRKKREKD